MEMSTRWRKELTWRCFLACAVSIVVVRECVIKCIALGHCSNLKWGSLIWFQQTFPTPYDQVRLPARIAVVIESHHVANPTVNASARQYESFSTC